MSDIREKEVKSISGIPFLFLLLAAAIAAGFVMLGSNQAGLRFLIVVLTVPILLIGIAGLYKVEPNQSAVLSLFGKYVGTVRTAGLRFNNPFYTKRKLASAFVILKAASSRSMSSTARQLKLRPL